MPISLFRYQLRILIFLGLIGTLFFFLQSYIIEFFKANLMINSIILFVFILGIFYNLWILSRLFREIRWINAFKKEEELPNKKLFFLRPIQSVENLEKSRQLTSQNTQFMLENVDARLEESKAISRYVISLLVFLGLLGTFWGLMITTSSLAEIFGGSFDSLDSENFLGQLLGQLSKPLSGMRTAFASSLFGLSASLIMGFIHLQVSQAQNRFSFAVEEILSQLTQWQENISLQQMQSFLEQSQTQINSLAQIAMQHNQTMQNIQMMIDNLKQDMPALYEQSQYMNQILQGQKQDFEQYHSELSDHLKILKPNQEHQEYFENILHFIAKRLEEINQKNTRDDKSLTWIELNEIKHILKDTLKR